MQEIKPKDKQVDWLINIFEEGQNLAKNYYINNFIVLFKQLIFSVDGPGMFLN